MLPADQPELLVVLDAIIASIQPGNNLPQEKIQQLQALLPDNLIRAALDLIDRENVVKYSSSWGHVHYEVAGTTATYSVFLDLERSPMTTYCSCPAFHYSVMISKTHLLCKHVLATRLARQLQCSVDRSLTLDNLASTIHRHYS
ncbi:hypothetical protein C8J56DRAFT_422971 [Mycena floridula]|nr:hypothetical protein C8J56DRAFT_422971 [Mycena floridula]